MRNERVTRPGTRLRGVVLDWAGTTVDYGSRAPVQAFREVFRAHGIEVRDEEVRAHMGLHKREHLQRILEEPRVAAAFRSLHGRDPQESDTEALFQAFVPAQMEVLEVTAEPLPGVVETVARWRERGLRIASTTGYTRDMLDRVAHVAAKRGYAPEAACSISEVSRGRPAPWMMFRVFETLDLWPPRTIVKVGDTPADVAEGLAAGCWTVALAVTGNEVGLSLEQWRALPSEERESRAASARARLKSTGAHYVVDDWEDLDEVIQDIEHRVAAGEAP